MGRGDAVRLLLGVVVGDAVGPWPKTGSAHKTLPFSCPLAATTAGNSRQRPASIFRGTDQCLPALTLRPATRGNTRQRAANDLKIHC